MASTQGDNPKFKTVLCKFYPNCFYENCKFAHGHHDLKRGKSPPRKDIYQQEKCKFYEKGNGMYGARCWFRHSNQVPRFCPLFVATGECYMDENCPFEHRR